MNYDIWCKCTSTWCNVPSIVIWMCERGVPWLLPHGMDGWIWCYTPVRVQIHANRHKPRRAHRRRFIWTLGGLELQLHAQPSHSIENSVVWWRQRERREHVHVLIEVGRVVRATISNELDGNDCWRFYCNNWLDFHAFAICFAWPFSAVWFTHKSI